MSNPIIDETAANITGTSLVRVNSPASMATLSDPAADRIMMWDESANQVEWMTAGAGLGVTATTLAIDSTVATLTGTQTLTNKTLTSPVLTTPQINDTSVDHQYIFGVSELAADRTVTLPLLTGNDIFVFNDFAATLTNKTLTSPVLTTPQINDTSSDHQYIFGVSELSADRTVTLPLLAGNDIFTFNAFAATLTNKTLTSPVLTTPKVNDTSADHQYIFGVSELVADRTVTLPLLAGNDIFTFNAFAATLTNKTMALGSNTISGTKAQFDTAVTDDNFAYLGTAQAWTADQTLNDNVKLTLGTGGDVDLYYDGTDVVLNTRVVGSGNFKVNGGNLIVAATNKIYLDGGGNTYEYESGADTWSWVVGGTERCQIRTTGNHGFRLMPFDNGSGVGAAVIIERNNNGSTPAAGYLHITDRGNQFYRIWPDDGGDIRIGTSDPTSANDTSGAVVGTQTSDWRAKTDIEPWDGAGALDAVLATQLYSYRFRDDGSRGDKLMRGIVIHETDRGGLWSTNDHRSDNMAALDEASMLGHLFAAIGELHERIELLEAS